MKTRTIVATGLLLILGLGILVLVGYRRTTSPDAKMAAALDQIRQVNLSRPERQTQAKMLIMATFAQKQIPEAEHWCDALNTGSHIWPVTPTNTPFALNASLAGRAMSPGMAGDTVVYFETSRAGWNQSGGAELLGSDPEGVAVAFADGRALILTPAQTANLRWSP